MPNSPEQNERALDLADFKFSAKCALSLAIIPVSLIGISVMSNPSVKNDPGMFVVASPFLFFGVFLPAFVFLVLGRRLWRDRKNR